MEIGQIAVTTQGEVGAKQVRYARAKIARVTRWISAPVLHARVKLTAAGDPARTRPAMAQATLDVDGQVLRAHVAGHEMTEAIDLLEERLRAQVEMQKDRKLALRKRGPGSAEPGEWRHGDLPHHRPPYFPRPVADRRVVRHKSYELLPLTPTEAWEELLRLDQEFHLFCDAVTGEDSVVFRLRDGGAELQSLSRPYPAPLLEEDQATGRLDLTGEPFLFFRDAASGRGAVVYRRYDGHYGVITPSVLVTTNHGPPRGALPRTRAHA
jgi:ribosome-associated translation inhibitor RaiA